MSISSVNSYKSQNFNRNNENKKGNNLRPKVVASSILATGAAFTAIAKKQGFSLKLADIKKTPIKDWALFRLFDKKHPDRKVIELEEKEIITLAGSSVLGGLAAGVAFDDKSQRKAKVKEAVNQFLGNVLVPVGCVSLVSRLYKKNKETILNLVPQIKENGKLAAKLSKKTVKNINSAFRAVPFSFATIGALSFGIVTGNKVSNFLNEKVFHKKVERKIKGSDFAPHVDDIGMAVSLMADRSIASSLIQRTVPAFLCVPGIEVGMHKEDVEKVK